jgi:hypothetical protein
MEGVSAEVVVKCKQDHTVGTAHGDVFTVRTIGLGGAAMELPLRVLSPSRGQDPVIVVDQRIESSPNNEAGPAMRFVGRPRAATMRS